MAISVIGVEVILEARADVGAAGECLKNFRDSELRVGVNTARSPAEAGRTPRPNRW
jgi:hypothetical protein